MLPIIEAEVNSTANSQSALKAVDGNLMFRRVRPVPVILTMREAKLGEIPTVLKVAPAPEELARNPQQL